MYSQPDKRAPGFTLVDSLHWGSHFCQFYESPQDLLDILVPYFKSGLQHKEFCLWVISAPLTIEPTTRALKKPVPNFEKYLNKKQI
jgi:hypothetical protein